MILVAEIKSLAKDVNNLINMHLVHIKNIEIYK
jgi:hypothetical protein